MAEYIDRFALIDAMQAYQYDAGKDGFAIMALIGIQPAADVAPVVRCKECKHCRELNRKDRIEEAYADGVLWCTNQSDGVWPDDFCSYGERKDGDDDAAD